MPTLTLTWPQVILLVITILAIYGLEMLFFYWRLRRHNFAQYFSQLRLQQLEQKVQALQRQLYPEPHDIHPPTLLDSAESEPPTKPEPTIVVPEHNLSEEMETVAPETGASYNRAIDLARKGAQASVLSRDCGLSRGEADLIVSLYGPPRK